MKTLIISILGFAALACSESEPRIEIIELNSSGITTFTSIGGVPTIYLSKELREEELVDLPLQDIRKFFDTQRSSSNELNVKLNAKTYILIPPEGEWISVRVEADKITSIEDSESDVPATPQP